MVDSIGNIGNIQSLNATSKADRSSNEQESKTEASKESRVIEDSVQISDEALNAAAAEQAALDVAKSLSNDTDVSLSSDPLLLNEQV